MTRALLVKMSSLGDVVHTLPAISDAAAHGVRFDWVVEEAFVDVARLHPAVERTFPIAWRRWRRQLLRGGRAANNRTELRAFLRELRAGHYDLVLDAQGLVKSGVVTALARGSSKFGFAARESLAAVCYGQRADVPKGQHAIAR